MSHRLGLTFDCADAVRLAEFWKFALGYEDSPPPSPYTSIQEWLAALGEPDTNPEDGAWLRDPTDRAWEWALAHRGDDGRLRSAIAEQLGRRERWGRWLAMGEPARTGKAIRRSPSYPLINPTSPLVAS